MHEEFAKHTRKKKQHLTETQTYGGRFTQSIINQEIVTIKQSLGNVTSTVAHLNDTVDSIRDSPKNETTLEARMITMENGVRNLMDSMDGTTHKRLKLESNTNLEHTRLTTEQEQMKNTLSNLQDQQAIFEDLQNSMDGQLRELDARIKTITTTYPTYETLEKKMQQIQNDITPQITTQSIATKNWVESNTVARAA